MPLTALVTVADVIKYVVLVPRKTKRFHTPYEATINTTLLRQFKVNISKLRLFLKQLKRAKWRRNNRYGLWLYTMKITKFGPIEFVIPIAIKSMDAIVNANGNDKQANGSIGEQTSFDGTENSYARLQNRAYYHSQVAVGDPIRSERTKRSHTTLTHHTKTNDNDSTVERI